MGPEAIVQVQKQNTKALMLGLWLACDYFSDYANH